MDGERDGRRDEIPLHIYGWRTFGETFLSVSTQTPSNEKSLYGISTELFGAD